MKKMSMKKILAGAMALTLSLSLVSCSTSAPTTATTPTTTTPTTTTTESKETDDAKDYKIAIVKQLDHASMDEIADAIAAQLDGADVTVTYEEFSGQNDASLLSQIGAQIIADEYDAIIPIGTLAAQQMVVAAEETQTPVVFAAVSDPETAGLTEIPYLTGTSDALNTPFMLDMMLAIDPDVTTVGLLYSTSQDNSIVPIADAKAYLDEKGIKYIEKTGNTNDEVIAAVNSMLDQVDAVFTPTDNVVMAVELAIAEIMADAGIEHYAGADSFVRNGAFATAGVNYADLGAKSADMALDVLETGDVPNYHVMDGGIITVNTEIAETLGADYSVFEDMAGTVVEVVTTEE